MDTPSTSLPHSSASSPPSAVPTLRVATWNLARSGGPDRVALIADHQLDLLCAQEVTTRAHEQLIASDVFDWGLHSLDHRPGPSTPEDRSDWVSPSTAGARSASGARGS